MVSLRAADLGALLRARVEAAPDKAAYGFYDRPDEPPVPITNADLDRASRAVAASLQAQHARGDRVLLLLPAGRAFLYGFFGCVRAGMVPVPAPPPARTRASHSLPPIQRIAGDCLPAAVLTTTPLAEALGAALDADDPLQTARWARIEHETRADAAAWVDPGLRPDDPAFLQYTSGSTADPKGVVVTHANLLANLATIQRGFAMSERDHGLIWLPPHHDMGLVGGLLAPLAADFPVSCLAANDMVQAPVRWLRAITEVGGTISGGPDFAYRLCVERIRDDQLHGIDLRSWRVAFTGAEPVSPSTMRAFADRFGPLGFSAAALYPCYGLAESTLMVTGGTAGAGARTRIVHDREMASCGAPIDPKAVVVVVDPDVREERAEGEDGEIWLQGPSVAAGYFGKPAETAEAFGAHLADGRGPFLRTGDIGFVLDGELFVTGRSKDTIIVQGRTLHAHDIEQAIRESVSIERGGLTAALSVLDDGREQFVVVQEAGTAAIARADEVGRQIQEVVAAQFGVRADHVLLTRVGTLPRTTSGKLRRGEASALLAGGRLRSAE